MLVRGLIEGRHYRLTTFRRERDGYYYVIDGPAGVEGWMKGSSREVLSILRRRVREMDERAEETAREGA